jgi:hypothetical protein
MRYLTSVALAALLMAAPAVASAQDQPTPAQIRAAAEAFDRGREAYKAEQYQEAAEQFERADANAPSATALELAIRSRDRAGNGDRAATLAALALTRHSDNAELTALANEVLEKAKPGLFELKVSCAEPCELVADSKIVHGARATERTLYLLPGAHAVVADFGEGRTTTQSVEAVETNVGEVAFEVPVQQVAPEPDPVAVEPDLSPSPIDDQGTKEKSSGWSPAVFWVGAGLTAVAGGVTIWSGVDTINNPGADRVRNECSDEDCQLYKDGVAKQDRTNVLIGVTGALGLATILVGALATDWSGGSKDEAGLTVRRSSQGYRRVELEPWVGLDGAGLGARGRF